MLQTAILVDGSDDPIALRIKDSEREQYISQGRAGQTPRNFKFIRMEGNVAIYRLDGEQRNSLSDSLFERIAKSEADKFLHPEKYADMGKQGALSNKEREELERLRAIVGSKEN